MTGVGANPLVGKSGEISYRLASYIGFNKFKILFPLKNQRGNDPFRLALNSLGKRLSERALGKGGWAEEIRHLIWKVSRGQVPPVE